MGVVEPRQNLQRDLFAFAPTSPSGPTHDGQPDSQGHPAMSSRVRATRSSCIRNSGSLNPMPPG